MPHAVDLGGKVVLVTGASRGLGRTLALGLAEHGADVALAARTREDLERTAGEVAKHGVRAVPFTADVSRPGDIDALVDDVVRAFGRLDVLINNAGIAGAEKAVVDLTAEDWNRVLAVNLVAPALCARAAARAMVERGGGVIVNVASIGGLRPIVRLGPYCASKAALVHLTRVMALELARHHVRVNAICPGYFATPMNEAFFQTPKGQEVIAHSIPMRRLGQPAELVPTVALMASDAAAFMTGSIVVLDGGQTLT